MHKTALVQPVDNAGPDQPAHMHCPLSESMATIVYVEKQRMLRSDCMDVHADLDLHNSGFIHVGLTKIP